MTTPKNLTPAYSFTIDELAVLGAALSATIEHVRHYGVQSFPAQMVMENPGVAQGLIVKLTKMLEAL